MRGILLALAALLSAAVPANVGTGTVEVRHAGGTVPVAAVAGKRIALSFDDIPRGAGAFMTQDQRAEALIAALRRARVPQAAFFVNPVRINPDTRGADHIKAYVAAGHVIADHSFTHPHLSGCFDRAEL